MVTLRDMENRTYPTDPSDEEWGLLEAYLPASKWRGRPRLHSPREILDAVFYVLKSGCRWRMAPSRVASLEDSVPLLQGMEARRHLRAYE
jgi:hypothetical protein